jgi:predicted metallo-beta-lactamase superfamily hydrolase
MPLNIMLKHIHVVPLAAESLGVRSMCTLVETSDVKILLDAGVSLCPNRFGLPPHPLEFRSIISARRRIAEAADKADIVSISHYHYDHVTPSFEDWLCNWTEREKTARRIYEKKVVLAKNPREQINSSQRERGWLFQRTTGQHAERFETADGKTFTFGNTAVRFSEPVFHGSENSGLGWVIMTTIQVEDESFLYASDVQGPMSSRTLEIILREKPQLIMIGGPPLYLSGFKVGEEQIQNGLINLERIIKAVPRVILDHHLVRDENWLEKTTTLLSTAHESGHTIQTAAEFIQTQNTFLEAKRKKLFEEYPPPKDFEQWMRLREQQKTHSKPPIDCAPQ